VRHVPDGRSDVSTHNQCRMAQNKVDISKAMVNSHVRNAAMLASLAPISQRNRQQVGLAQDVELLSRHSSLTQNPELRLTFLPRRNQSPR
jgi:hypothetical protein